MGVEAMDSRNGHSAKRQTARGGKLSRRRSPRARRVTPTSRRSRVFWAIGVALIALIAFAGIITMITRDAEVLAGEVVVEFSEYDFGTVPIDGGLISAQFPLQAAEPATITRIEST
jgi:hypothetical protein